MINKFKKAIIEIFKNKKNIYCFIFVLILASVCILLFNNNFVQAATDEEAKNYIAAIGGGLAKTLAVIFSWLIGLIINALGLLLSLLMSALIGVAQYNSFLSFNAVTYGWVVIRDICNMFFILMLLIIAFATILRMENYNINKMLPKLILMAVLINFSKTICGLIIDFSQVIMLTFVNSFKDVGGGNLTQMLGIQKLLTFKTSGDVEANPLTITASYILALIYVIISIVVVGCLLVMLVMRIVMLWILIVLSPFAYFLSIIPEGSSYASTWWKKFTETVMVGPILAFFIWLSFASLGNVKTGSEILNLTGSEYAPQGLTEAGSFDHMIKFAISIAFLLGGLTVAQGMAGGIGAVAGKGMAALQSGKQAAFKGIRGAADWVNRKQASKTGVDFNLARTAATIKTGFEKGKSEDLSKMRRIASERMAEGGAYGLVTGLAGGAEGWTDQIRGGKLFIQAARGLARFKLKGSTLTKKYEDKKSEFDNFGKLVISDEEYTEQMKSLNDNESKEQENIYTLTDENKKFDTEMAGAKGARKTELKKKIDGNNEKITDSDKLIKSFAYEKSKLNKRKDEAKKTVDDNGNKLFVGTKNEAQNMRARYKTESDRLLKEITKFMVVDYEGANKQKAEVNAIKREIDDKDEDSLISKFVQAQELGNDSMCQALVHSLAEINGTNALLSKYGYQATAGYSDKEYEELMKTKEGKEEYEKNKGWNDFVRDQFEGKLKMNKQSALRFQGDVGSIGEDRGADHLTKITKVTASGRLERADNEEREYVKLVEMLKGEGEGIFRKKNRLCLGAEDSKTGEFKFSSAGLAFLVNNMKLFNREMIQNGRLNKSMASAVSQEGALKQLKEKFAQLGIKTLDVGKDGKKINIEEWEKELKMYAEMNKESNTERLLKP